MRRAVAAVFAWVFIMLAGAMIIGLFFSIANAQAEAGKDRLSLQALEQVNSILHTQQTSAGTATTVPIPDSDIRLTCRAFLKNGEVTLLSQLDIGGMSRSLEDQLVVGRDLQADELVLFSKQWRAPYRIANVLHVSSEDELLLLGRTSSAGEQSFQRLNESFPDVVNKQVIDADTEGVNPRSWQNVRVVVLGTDPAPDPDDINFPLHTAFSTVYVNQEHAQYMYIEYDSSADVLEAGKITYYTYDGGYEEQETFTYAGEAMLTALIWQADPQRASCLQHKLKHALERQTELQLERLQALTTRYDQHGNTACSARYSQSTLEDLRAAAGEPLADYEQTGKLYDFDISQEAAQVRNKNEAMLRGERCATIY